MTKIFTSGIVKGQNSRKLLALQKFQACTTTSGDVAHLVSKPHLLNCSNRVSSSNDGCYSLATKLRQFLSYSLKNSQICYASLVSSRKQNKKDCPKFRFNLCTSVPAANLSNSNTPIGPFQIMVFVVSRTSLNDLIESGPISNPIQPSGIPEAGTICISNKLLFNLNVMTIYGAKSRENLKVDNF